MPYPQRCRDQMQAPIQPTLFSLIVQSLKCARAPARGGIRRDPNPERDVRQSNTAIRGAVPGDAAAFAHREATCSWVHGLADVDLPRLGDFHRAHGWLATLTAVHAPARFGRLTLAGDRITAFREKTIDPDKWINGAFFVLESRVFQYIAGDETQFEREPLSRLATEGQLMAHRQRASGSAWVPSRRRET